MIGSPLALPALRRQSMPCERAESSAPVAFISSSGVQVCSTTGPLPGLQGAFDCVCTSSTTASEITWKAPLIVPSFTRYQWPWSICVCITREVIAPLDGDTRQ